MFSETEAKLAMATYSALVEVASGLGKNWKWKPKVGDWGVMEALEHHVGIIGKYNKDKQTVCFYIPFDQLEYKDVKLSYAYQLPDCPLDYITPIFHWKEMEKILSSFGYKLFMRFEVRAGGYFQVAVYDIVDRFSSYGIGETAQEAVMKAVIELAERQRIHIEKEHKNFRATHGYYDCCAICDCKIKRAGSDAAKKEKICPQCKAKLAKKGIAVRNVKEFIEWIRNEKAEKVVKILKDLRYRFCVYFNDVDQAVIEKTNEIMEVDDDRYLTLSKNQTAS